MSKKQITCLLFVACIICAMLHVKAFTVKHVEGDEYVYLTLAEEMGWDFSHYTTMDNPSTSIFPAEIYRQPLFLHPPLFPYILKIGKAIGYPVETGLTFQLVSYFLLILVTVRMAILHRMSAGAVLMLVSMVILCPILVFSTTRLHLDGIAAIFFFCAMSFYFESLENYSAQKAVLSGIVLGIALNLRFSSLALLPAFCIIAFFHYYQAVLDKNPSANNAARQAAKLLGLVMAVGLLLGGSHYVRLVMVYKTLFVLNMMKVEPGAAAWNQFIANLLKRTRFQMLTCLLLAIPAWVSLLVPGMLRACNGSKKPCIQHQYIAVAVYVGIVMFVGSFNQLRYFAPMTPFLYFAVALGWDRMQPGKRLAATGLFALPIILMAASCYRIVVLDQEANILPAAYEIFPFLMPYFPQL